MIELAALLRFVRFADEWDETTTARTKSVWTEAKRRGIRMQEVVIGGLRRDEMRALLPSRPGGTHLRWEYFESLPIPPWLEQEVGPWIDDKHAFKQVFLAHGLPVARGGAVVSFSQARELLRRFAAPVITKPEEGSRARHTTVGIRNEEELREGFDRAKQLCPFVMVEEFIEGTLYRATCVGRRLVGVIQFVKPAVVADGVRSVEELRQYHNAHKRYEHLTDVRADDWFFDAVKHQGYTPDSVPPSGTTVLLSEHSERPNGGYFIDVTDRIPAATVATIERAAEVCDVEVIGFDIISPDLTDPRARYTFIEGNTLPYIEIHDIPYEGTPRNVAGALWDLWFPAKKGSAGTE